jgi:hypothetical protein
MKKILVLILLLACSFSVLAQESFSSVEERMTGKEFMDTGLSKLTDVELDALNKWLKDHSLATLGERVPAAQSAAPTANQPTTQPSVAVSSTPAQTTVSSATATTPVAVVDRRGLEGKDNDRTTIVSNFIGEYKGWDGETVFKLSNGMIWKQAETSRHFTKLLINPQITIKAGMWDSWYLTVEGYNRNVKVKRIQ